VRARVVPFQLGPVGRGAEQAADDRVDALCRSEIIADGSLAIDCGRVESKSHYHAGAILAGRAVDQHRSGSICDRAYRRDDRIWPGRQVAQVSLHDRRLIRPSAWVRSWPQVDCGGIEIRVSTRPRVERAILDSHARLACHRAGPLELHFRLGAEVENHLEAVLLYE
jgi:hypothetical protein